MASPAPLLVGEWLLGEVGAPFAACRHGGLTRLGHGAGDEAGEHLGEQPVTPPPAGPPPSAAW